ncbi:protein kinase domain-containing protein [Verrucosispora sioxanthis]|uniref:protein kinase domain-containing protein n=1 Tax=Verrucosispora sioxanthis TaxID=2499994 RepID=UPI00359F8F13
MGTVWRAEDELLHRQVAIKQVVLPAWLGGDELDQLRARTLREARTAARLNHPNVVRVYDVVSEADVPWIVMEYVPSRTLQDLLDADGPLPPQRAARIGLALLDALRAAHDAGVLHRDVKPANVLVADDGRVLLTDFGLAVFDGGDQTMTGPGTILGSPQYVAPERAAEGVSSEHADLWSLGATLHAAVEGRAPYARTPRPVVSRPGTRLPTRRPGRRSGRRTRPRTIRTRPTGRSRTGPTGTTRTGVTGTSRTRPAGTTRTGSAAPRHPRRPPATRRACRAGMPGPGRCWSPWRPGSAPPSRWSARARTSPRSRAALSRTTWARPDPTTRSRATGDARPARHPAASSLHRYPASGHGWTVPRYAPPHPGRSTDSGRPPGGCGMPTPTDSGWRCRPTGGTPVRTTWPASRIRPPVARSPWRTARTPPPSRRLDCGRCGIGSWPAAPCRATRSSGSVGSATRSSGSSVG